MEPPRRVSRRQVLRLTAVTGIAAALGVELTTSLLRRAGLHKVSRTEHQLGTQVTVTVVHPDLSGARLRVDATFLEIERLESILSRHRPETPVGRLARAGTIADAPSELLTVLGRATHYSSLTEGAFDVTVAPLLDLYRKRLVEGGASPLEREVEDARELVDYRRIRVDGTTVSFDRRGMAITLDAIAKGYVVDRSVEALLAAGAERVLVQAGGDIATAGGSESGEAWQVAIQDPRNARQSLGVVHLRGEATSTSGDYMQAFTEDRSLHHILDPRTGRSPDHTSAVTVVAPTAMDSDALSTSAFVLGPVEGLALLERLDGVEGLIVTKDGKELQTRGFTRTS